MKMWVLDHSKETSYGYKDLLYLIVDGKVSEEQERKIMEKDDFPIGIIYDKNTDLSYFELATDGRVDEFNQFVKSMEELGYNKTNVSDTFNEKIENRIIDIEYGGYVEDEDGSYYEETIITIPCVEGNSDEWQSSIPYPEYINLVSIAYLGDEGFLLEEDEAIDYFGELIKQDNVNATKMY